MEGSAKQTLNDTSPVRSRVYTKDVGRYIGEEITVKGWVHNIRDLKNIKFMIVRDKTGTVQCVALRGQTEPQSFENVSDIHNESVVEVVGTVHQNKEARQGYEILIRTVNVLSPCLVKKLPVDVEGITETSLDKRLDYRYLDTRREVVSAIFKVRSKIFKSAVDYLDSNGFININTPKLTSLGVESGAEVFTVDYYGKKMYLAQSPQVYKQMFVVGGFERVYEVGPVFRAEKSHTKRHLSEFTGIDFELGFIKDENDVMDVCESLVKHICEFVSTECKEELKLLNVEPIRVPKTVPRIEMREIKRVLREEFGKELSEDDDLDSESEKMVGRYVRDRYDSDIVFVTRYPWKKRPFYHMRPDDDPNTTRSFDMLLRGSEIVTGSQREHRVDVLVRQAKEKGIDPNSMTEYIEMFRYGAPPHGGAGFGLDRITEQLLALDNIREAVLLPRDPERLRP